MTIRRPATVSTICRIPSSWPWAIGTILAIVIAPHPGYAQTFRQPDTNYEGIVLQASALVAIPLGSEFDSPSVSVGPGVEALGRWVFPNMISAGAGIRYSAHDLEGFSKNASFLSLFGQIGYTFIFDSSPLRPTLGGRIGWTNYETAGGNRSGLNVGVIGGVELPVSKRVAFAGTLTFDFLTLNQLSPLDPTDGTAQMFAIEAGVVLLP